VLQVELVSVEDRGLGVSATEHGRYSGVWCDDAAVGELALLAPLPAAGRVVCATQVIEAGVDISARLLVTEVAPWSSVVQRLGRCNRRAEHEEGRVRWVDVKRAEPYDDAALRPARAALLELEGGDVSPRALSALRVEEPEPALPAVLRRRDLLDLYDTAPDLSGNDLDVARFVRDVEDVDCRVFWRTWEGEEPPPETDEASADELCPVAAGELRKLVETGRSASAWDALNGRWSPARRGDIRPGLVVLLPAAAGGYTAETGWDPASKAPVEVLHDQPSSPPDANRADPDTPIGAWVDLATHSRDVETEVAAISAATLDGEPQLDEVLRLAARGHDIGKALGRWQDAVLAGIDDETDRALRRATVWAKTGARRVRTGERNPRHELVSALALLRSGWLAERLAVPWADVALFLVAAHHGKARVTIRPWPGDRDGQVLGVGEGDRLPAIELDGLSLPEQEISLRPLRMGDDGGSPSWAARMLRLRDDPTLGPFRLAFLEAILRCADWRASEREERPGGD
jgi:CRISPR-associated endonuclease/helicase Cas3